MLKHWIFKAFLLDPGSNSAEFYNYTA